MELSYILLVCSFTYFSLSDVYCTDGGSYEYFPCSDPSILSSSRCLLREAEVDKECDCQALCDDDDRCVFVFYNPDTKTCRLYDHNKKEIDTTGLECARIVDCGVPDFGDGVDANYKTTTYGSVAEIECALGYFSTTDDIQSVCQDSGQWSDPTGLCEVVDCGVPDFGDVVDANYNTTTYGSVAEIECALGYFSTTDDIQSVCQDSGQWSDPTGLCEVVDCGVPDFGDGVDANYNTTTYGSVAEMECALGYFPITDDIQSVCQDSGQWSDSTKLCKEYPRGMLRASKELPDSDAVLECRNEVGEPTQRSVASVAICSEDEVMTGCSTTTDLRMKEPAEPQISLSRCIAGYYPQAEGTRVVARCCKLPGTQCEHFANAEPSCFKDFRLFDCLCRKSRISAGPCPILMNGNNCDIPSEFADPWPTRYSMCCDLGDFSCYRKNMTGPDTGDSDLLKIRCDDASEVMTSCHGYSNDYGLFGSLIKNVAGTDECQLDPGPGDISQLYGYITCCKRNQ